MKKWKRFLDTCPCSNHFNGRPYCTRGLFNGEEAQRARMTQWNIHRKRRLDKTDAGWASEDLKPCNPLAILEPSVAFPIQVCFKLSQSLRAINKIWRLALWKPKNCPNLTFLINRCLFCSKHRPSQAWLHPKKALIRSQVSEDPLVQRRGKQLLSLT